MKNYRNLATEKPSEMKIAKRNKQHAYQAWSGVKNEN